MASRKRHHHRECVSFFIDNLLGRSRKIRHHIMIHTMFSTDLFGRYDAIVQTKEHDYYLIISSKKNKSKSLSKIEGGLTDDFIDGTKRQAWIVLWEIYKGSLVITVEPHQVSKRIIAKFKANRYIE